MAGSILNIIHPTYYADTINGSGTALSGLVDPNGQPIAVGVACYVANGDGAGNPVVWTCAVSTAAVDHSTVEAVSGATGCRWLKSGAFAGGGGGLTPIPNNNVLGNVSGSSATPTAMTAAQLLTMLGVTPFSDARSAAIIRAQALCGTTLNVLTGTEFDRSGDFVATVAAGGSAQVSATARAGVVRLQTSTTTSSTAAVTLAGTSPWGTVIDDAKTSRWYAIWYVKMATAVDAQSQLDCQLQAGGNMLLSIGQAGGIGTTNWRVRLLDGGGNSVTNAAVTAAIDTNWHTVEAWNDGTNLTVAIDTVQQYQTALTALASGGPVGPRLFSQNGATATNRELDCDRMYVVVASN